PRYGAAEQGYRPHPHETEVHRAYPDEVGAATGYAGTPEPPPERNRRRGPVLAVLAAVLVLALAGTTAFYLLGQDDETPSPVSAPTEQAAPPPDSDALDEDEAPPSDPAANSSTDPRFVRAGQCVSNEAPASTKPKLLISDCVSKSYEVLQRFDGKTSGEKDAEEKCAKVDGYTNWYFYDSELDSLDFVLCLKQRG
ncbi:LppU/SCO3897 family protein, partial [Micromonospora phaseoli]